MKFFLAALALAAVGASAQSSITSTVTAPCGTDCPSAAAPKMITRSSANASESTPCPSLSVSSIAGAGNGTKPMNVSPMSPSATHFTGGAAQIGGSIGAMVVAAAAVLAL